LNLFKQTQNDVAGLSAVLLSAKKRGIIAYEGHMLMQNFNDDVIITLLTDKVDDHPAASLVDKDGDAQKTGVALKLLSY